MTDRTDPVVEARPLTAEEEADLRRNIASPYYVTPGTFGAYDRQLHRRLLATLDTARAAVPEPSLRGALLALAETWWRESQQDRAVIRDADILQRCATDLRAALTDPSKPDEPA